MTDPTIHRLSGYITQAKFLRSQSTAEVEKRIGYRVGRLAKGYTLFFLVERLLPADFEFRGYSQMSGGKAYGHLPGADDRPNAEQSLRKDGYDVKAMKERICRDTFEYKGPDRLCKVIPIAGEFGENDYPPGAGIPQWEILRSRPKRFQVAEVIQPNGRYLGNYT